MANLPERICVWDMDKDDPTSSRGWSVSFPEDHPAIYVRADHYAALEAQLAEAKAAFSRMVALYESEYDPDAITRPQWVRDALSALEATPPAQESDQ